MTSVGTLPSHLSGLKGGNVNLGFAKRLQLVKVSDLKSIRSPGRKVLVIRNSNPGPDIAELQPASEGSSLLGKILTMPVHYLALVFIQLILDFWWQIKDMKVKYGFYFCCLFVHSDSI